MNDKVINVIEDITSKFSISGVDRPKDNQIAFDVKTSELHSVLAYVKSIGFTQLSILSCVDWIDDNEFQLVYIVFDWKQGIRLQVRTRIDRDNPVYKTATTIYPGAKYYERDVHEFFGVEFIGNPDSNKQLFLENWDDMPPLRKDFDSVKYSDAHYPAREYKANFETKAGDKK